MGYLGGHYEIPAVDVIRQAMMLGKAPVTSAFTGFVSGNFTDLSDWTVILDQSTLNKSGYISILAVNPASVAREVNIQLFVDGDLLYEWTRIREIGLNHHEHQTNYAAHDDPLWPRYHGAICRGQGIHD